MAIRRRCRSDACKKGRRCLEHLWFDVTYRAYGAVSRNGAPLIGIYASAQTRPSISITTRLSLHRKTWISVSILTQTRCEHF